MPAIFCSSLEEIRKEIHRTIRSTLVLSGYDGRDGLGLLDDLYQNVAPIPNISNVILYCSEHKHEKIVEILKEKGYKRTGGLPLNVAVVHDA